MIQETSKTEIKNGLYFKCKKCGDEIYHNTNMWPLSCSCGAMAIQCDGMLLVGEGDPAYILAFEKYGKGGAKTREIGIIFDKEQ